MSDDSLISINDSLSNSDSVIASIIDKEKNRQESHLELIASENFASQAVRVSIKSCFALPKQNTPLISTTSKTSEANGLAAWFDNR